ncbi:MAG: hypothetical protein N3F09_03780 [Bacteroidia bacterium]|nr:hypothetical protein [Bacteroidia bacterium]
MSEWFYGVSFLRKYGINKFFYFGSFENDAVFFSLLSKKLGVKCVFVTSQNPLSAFYSHIVADEIFFSAPYHEEEFHQLKSNWYVDSFCHVPPFEFKELYSEVKPDPPRYKVGFLSGGSYRRLDWKDRYFDDGFYESELEILRILNEISLDINPIAIFLHPCEKENEELLERAKKFYTQQLTNKKFVFINPHTRSFKHFYEVDLCITVYSSSAQERLFMGYKTLFAPLQVKTRYYKGLSLESVVCYSEAELTDKIKTSLQISNNDFFRYYGLEKYHFNNYNKYLSEVSVWN